MCAVCIIYIYFLYLQLCEIIAGAPDPLYVPMGKLDDAVFDHNIESGDLQLQYSITGDENRQVLCHFNIYASKYNIETQ